MKTQVNHGNEVKEREERKLRIEKKEAEMVIDRKCLFKLEYLTNLQ
jgi:hypothetical protein